MTTTKEPAPTAVRAGATEVDLDALAALRDWLLAKDAYDEAERALKAARAAVDAAAGNAATATHRGAPVFTYRERSRRGVDLARLEEHWVEAYKDCLRETSHFVLVVDDAHERTLYRRDWRAALRRGLAA